MSPIPIKLRKELVADRYYKTCCLKEFPNHICGGRITWEHTIIYAGSQLQTRWAIIPICASAHNVDAFQDAGTIKKEVHVWVALNRALPSELQAISKATDYFKERARLNNIYGIYLEPIMYPEDTEKINY